MFHSALLSTALALATVCSALPVEPAAPSATPPSAPSAPPQAAEDPNNKSVTSDPVGALQFPLPDSRAIVKFAPGVLHQAIMTLCDGIGLDGTVYTGPLKDVNKLTHNATSTGDNPSPYSWEPTNEDYGWGPMDGYKCHNIPTIVPEGRYVTLFMRDSQYHPNRCINEAYSPFIAAFGGGDVNGDDGKVESIVPMQSHGDNFDYVLLMTDSDVVDQRAG